MPAQKSNDKPNIPDAPKGSAIDLGGVALGSSRSAVATSSTHVKVFHAGPNNHLWTSTHDAGQWWSAPVDVGNVGLGSDPAAVSIGGHVTTFFRGANGHLTMVSR